MPRVRFFGLTRRVKNYSTNEFGAFAHVSGAAEVTVNTTWGRSNTKQSLPSTHTNDGEDITPSSVYTAGVGVFPHSTEQ